MIFFFYRKADIFYVQNSDRRFILYKMEGQREFKKEIKKIEKKEEDKGQFKNKSDKKIKLKKEIIRGDLFYFIFKKKLDEIS